MIQDQHQLQAELAALRQALKEALQEVNATKTRQKTAQSLDAAPAKGDKAQSGSTHQVSAIFVIHNVE